MGPFFLVTSGILVTGPQRLRRSRQPGLLGVRAQPDFGNRADSGNSFGNSFGNKTFLEQLCFSIDLAVSSLLLPMLPKNP